MLNVFSVCPHACTHTYTYMYTHTHTRTHAHTHTRTHTRTHTHTHTYTTCHVFTTHHFSLDTNTGFLQQILLQACSYNPSIWIKYQLNVLSKSTGVVVECCAGITKCFQNGIELKETSKQYSHTINQFKLTQIGHTASLSGHQG